MRKGLSIVAPCFNEQDNVRELYRQLVQALAGFEGGFEVVLVDDASTDDTWGELQRLQKEFPDSVIVRHLESNQGMFKAWQVGLDVATGVLACLIDADLQNPPGEIVSLLERFKDSRADLVQGVRSSIERHRDSRFIASRVLNTALNLAFQDRARDNKSGFLIGPLDVLRRVVDFKMSYRFPQTFVRVSARSLGYSIAEQETLFRPRRVGNSFLAGLPSWRIYLDVLRDFPTALKEFGRGKRHPTESLVKISVSEEVVVRKESTRERLTRAAYFSTMPLHAWLLKGTTYDYYRWLQQSQWSTRQDLENLQLQRLTQLLWHAYQHVPYYRRQMSKYGLHPRDIQSIEDLRRLPLLEKSDVRENLYMGLFSDQHVKKEMQRIATSGSTGQPFVTYADRQQLEVRFASTLRSLEWTGWRFGDRQLRLWHQRLGMSPSEALRERVDASFLRRKFIPAFELTAESMGNLARTIEKVQPVLMDGYAESFNFIATYLAAGGKINANPKAVMSSAQTLTASTRLQIEAMLGAEVYDKYGAREFSGIAYECSAHDGHHVLDESYIVEVLRDGRQAQPGEVGEIVVTDLNNYSVPLIRYRIGDLTVAMDPNVSCPCGRGLSKIGDIQGRTQALVHCANGRWLPGTFFAHFFKDHDHLVAFYQIVQNSRGAFNLKVVKATQWSERQWSDLMSELRGYVGETDIDVEYVHSIPLLATGKRTPVISSLSIDFQEIK